MVWLVEGLVVNILTMSGFDAEVDTVHVHARA